LSTFKSQYIGLCETTGMVGMTGFEPAAFACASEANKHSCTVILNSSKGFRPKNKENPTS